jgi:hypothetical protein
MSLSFSPGQRAALDLRTAEWGNRVNDYVSTGTQNLRANNEQSTIHTHNTTWQSEGPQFAHDSQTHVGTESTTARHLIFPEMADRTSQYATDAEFALRLNSYLLHAYHRRRWHHRQPYRRHQPWRPG